MIGRFVVVRVLSTRQLVRHLLTSVFCTENRRNRGLRHGAEI